MGLAFAKEAEWLESDGLGGFASGTVSGRRTRRYHAILLAATEPPSGRMVLVNGFDAAVETDAGSHWISSQFYAPDVVAPNGADFLEAFSCEPWPRWVYRLSDGTVIEQELFVPHGTSAAALHWRLGSASGKVTLRVRPFLSGRGYHALHHENPAFCTDAQTSGDEVRWQPYAGVPFTTAITNGQYDHQPVWYRRFLYERERDRGLDDTEDLLAPGTFSWDLRAAEAVCFLATEGHEETVRNWGADPYAAFTHVEGLEQDRREELGSRLQRAADCYLVAGRGGKTVIAGFPWFTDWGRDTFISLRGLCLATGRLADAGEILAAWAGTVDRGMLPNLFPDQGSQPEFNSVDASLWYIIACHEYLETMQRAGKSVSASDRKALAGAIEAILEGYSAGTRYQIHRSEDGLLAAGQAGVQLTWMDAKVGDWVVTPRIGKPVEVQALWLNALAIGSRQNKAWKPYFEAGLASFESRFWNPATGNLFDVVDADHRADAVDDSFRPNQSFGVGGLPQQLIKGPRARQIVDAVEARLWTRLGLRSLAPDEPQYAPHYQGGPKQRDGSYHQGTVWPWLAGAFIEAWIRVRGSTDEARRVARERFLPGFEAHLDVAGIGHVSEITDADSPHTPRGCPFQAWSLAELLRLRHGILSSQSAAEALAAR
jgi:predicted glycogen debranching enzyme